MKTEYPSQVFRRFNLFRTSPRAAAQGKQFTGERVYELTGEAAPRGPKKVLMLEDDLEFAKIIRMFLGSHSFRVTCVPNGADGLRHIMKEDFDIILCDMVMPNLPGDMFYLAVERTKPHLCSRFVFMTGHQADPKYDEFIRKVHGPMLWKPFLMADLLSALQRTLEKNSPNFKPKSTAEPQESKWWM